MRILTIAVTLLTAGLPLCLGSCSSESKSGGCTVDSECKGDRICGPAGTCVSPNATDGGGAAGDTGEPAGHGATMGAGDAGGGGAAAGAGSDEVTVEEGTPCEISGSNCDADCLSNCGSPNCVDLCCSDTTSLGVRCDGQCRAPTCTVNEAFEAELATRPWICFETEANGKTYCGCTNYETAAVIKARGDQVVESCSGSYCAYFDDEGNRDCQCRGDDASIKLPCSHAGGCRGSIANCDDAPVPTCESKCAMPVWE